MESNNTAYNEYILCQDCTCGQVFFMQPDVTSDSEFHCPRWGKDVKHVGICKYFTDVKDK